MDEQQIRHLVNDVKAGRMSRRAFTRIAPSDRSGTRPGAREADVHVD